jgi:hypothetical protein
MQAPVARVQHAPVEVRIIEDEGDVRNAACAFFNDGESHVRYALAKDGKIWVLGIYSDGDISGRSMVTWLARAYGRVVQVAEVASSATGFWDKMLAEGLIEDWVFDRFRGRAVPMPPLESLSPISVFPPILGYHATTAAEDFDRFEYTEDVGYHFGSIETANNRLEQIADSEDEDAFKNARVIPCWLHISRPLRLHDCFTWESRDTMLALQKAGVLTGSQFDELWDDGFLDQEMFREIVERAGYDSIVYANQTEGGGDSYIVLDPDRIHFALARQPAAPAPSRDAQHGAQFQWCPT